MMAIVLIIIINLWLGVPVEWWFYFPQKSMIVLALLYLSPHH